MFIYHKRAYTIMARGRKRSRRGFQVIPFTANITLGTLNVGVVVQAAIINFGEDYFALSVDAVWTLTQIDTGEGPLDIGFSHGDLSTGEIGEALDAEVSDPDDIIQRERARRPVRRSGQLSPRDGSLAGGQSQLDDGAKVRTRLKFSIGDGHTLDVWARNRGAGNLAGGMIIVVDGTIYGRWQR